MVGFRGVVAGLAACGALALFAGAEADFDKAVKAGHPLSAETAYLKLGKNAAGTAPVRHYLAAMVADQLGKGTLRDDRLLLYLRLEKGWTPQVEKALWRLVATGSDVDLFARLSANTKADAALWQAGRGVLSRLAAANRPAEVLRLADILLTKFPETDRVASVLSTVYSNGQNGGETYPRQELFQLVSRHPGLGDLSQLYSLLNWSSQRAAFPPDFVIRYVAKHGGPIQDSLLSASLGCLNVNGLAALTDAEAVRESDARVAKVKKIEPVVFDGEHPTSALRYVRIATLCYPEGFFKDYKKNEPLPGAASLLAKLTAHRQYAESPYYRRDVNYLRRELTGAKRLTEAETARFEAAEEKFPKQNPALGDAIKKMYAAKGPAAIKAEAEKALPLTDANSTCWGDFDWACSQVKNDDFSFACRKRRADLTGDFNGLASCVPKGSEKPYPGVDMAKMTPANALSYVQNVWAYLKGPVRNSAVLELLKAKSLADLSYDGANWVLSVVLDRSFDAALMAQMPVEKIASEIFTGSPRLSWSSYNNALHLAHRAKKLDGVFDRFAAWVGTLEPQQRIQAWMYVSATSVCSYTPDGKAVWEPLFDDARLASVVKERLLPAFRELPDVRSPLLNVNFGPTFWQRVVKLRAMCAKDESKAAEVALYDAFDLAVVAKLCAGAKNDEGDTYESIAWHRRLNQALEAKDAVAVAAVARRCGNSAAPSFTGHDTVRKALADLRAFENKEAFYLYVDAVPSDRDAWLVADAAKCRAELASALPGIYPVGENDPSYPLYVAADELSKKNSERAWQILQNPSLQTVFEREALKLPPDFVVWGVEQLRMARGEKDALLLKARQIATAILAQESKVSPEVAAAMLLSRAEGYRDQQNFEAAKLEYQSVRDNPTYHATSYGKKAMFRAVDLQIATGNAQGVEATLEYWMSQNDREVQAQAHYFMARLAYDRKDYDECIKQLRQVFAIDYTHTEGRFLHGDWKLATNSEVDDTDVLVGDLAERNMICPGNQLTVTVQDSNLSIAGGGSSIPVIVRSDPSGDVERIGLYPSSRDPSNFKGLVEVMLGRASPSNRVLEVSGEDTVSYVIDPDFLKARGLPVTAPKRLRIIDDAKLAIGAGAPRTEESRTEKGVRDLLDDDTKLEDSSVTRKLRPGNPLYVVVRDRDRSLGGAEDAVTVTVETSSGDRVENFRLVEEKPFSGVFRGKVETSLPPPRAFASDTAIGMEPGEVINAHRTGGWKSLADGLPGKWFEVDTMGSHLFSEITLDTPAADDIKTIKLVGRMGSKVMQLGSLPEAKEESKFGLRCQQQYDGRPPRAMSRLRAYFQTDAAAKPKKVEGVAFRVLQNNTSVSWQKAFYGGPFVVAPGTDSLRFRIVPRQVEKDALRGLWVTFSIDGEEVFSGQGVKLRHALVSADVTPGCHRFELAVVAGSRADEFDFCLDQPGQEPKAIPADWFDESRHAALRNFVKDQVQIVKTANGFKAVFTKPIRLRSFRWEFADVKSPAVTLTRISAKNDVGDAILPVESDFSDAQSNRTLEVAPGDRVTVSYADERTTSGEKKVLQREVNSSFNDASVRFISEAADDRGQIRAYDAFRFRPGDSLVLAVTDPDCDVSDAADRIEVTIRNADGKSVTKKLVEYRPRWLMASPDEDTSVFHTGIFMGILKTCHEGDTNAPPKVLRVRSDDCLTVSYEDRENTDPGVPTERTARIFAVRAAAPQMTLFQVNKVRAVDNSADAKIALDRIRRRPGNENVSVVYRDVLMAEPMAESETEGTNAIPVNVAAGAIPIRVNDRSLARAACSKVTVEAVAHSEKAAAEAEGRAPEKVRLSLPLAGSLAPFRLTKGDESTKEAQAAGTFNGLLRLSLGPVDPNIEVPDNAPPLLCVTGSDQIDVSVLSDEGEPILTRTLKLVSDASLSLTDSSFAAERNSAHVGECFYVKVDDADRDKTDESDSISAEAVSVRTGVKRPLTLTETLPHSGVFTGRLRPVMFAPDETIPSVATGGVASAHEVLTEDRFAVGYGDQVVIRYRDDLTLPGTPPRTLCVTGSVFRGSNGSVRLFSKRFADRDSAVLVQFRLAECLFEQAKEHRRLKQPEKSAAAIDEGKFILEEALKNYPDSAHVVQGEFLLANLYQELANEEKEAGNPEKAAPLFQEALSRFSQILGTWPEGDYAARSQYHKALCLEMLEDYSRASEEYVKMTYLYPESELVGEATIRLATYYYTKEKRYDISGHIYRNFQQRFPQHEKSPRALFMAGSCFIKQAETFAEELEKASQDGNRVVGSLEKKRKIDDCYKDAIATFDTLVDTYRDTAAKLKAQTLYWAGDVCVRRRDYPKAYQYLKRTVFEYPETEWARRARGLLLQEEKFFKEFE